jgi:hypothetical protein
MKKLYPILLTLLVAGGLHAQTTWDNFEDSRKGTYGFINGAFIPYSQNPAPGGSNNSLVAASYTRNAAETFDVIVLDGQMADLSDYLSGAKQMSIDVWSPAAGTTVQITLENSTLAQPANFPEGRHSVYLATTTVAQQWETLTFSFDNQPDASVANDNVDRIVLLFAPNTNTGDTYYWDNLNAPELAEDPCDGVTPDESILNDFECNQNTNFTFSHAGVNFRRVVNPDMDGNPSDYVASYIRNGGEEADVIIGRFDGNLDVAADSKITMDVWDPNAPTDVIFSLQTVSGDLIIELATTTTTSGAWETIEFDPSPVSESTDIGQFVILFDPGNFTSDNYFFDNIEISGSSSVEELEKVVSFKAFPNPTQGVTNFQYELESSANVQLSIFNVTGQEVAQLIDQKQTSGTHSIQWLAENEASGLYFYTLTIDGKTATGKLILK